MDAKPQSKHIGRKVWYGTAIVLSVLALLVCAAGVMGTWVVERSLANLAVTLLAAVEDTAGGVRQFAGRIDQGANEVRAISSEVSSVSSQISQNVEDQGLIRLLLPEEKEQKLDATIQSIRDTLNTVTDVARSVLELYDSIDRLPLVSLPRPSATRVEEMQQTVADTQANVETLRQGVQDVRGGAAGGIDRVTQAADRVTTSMDNLSSDLAQLDSDLAALQDLAVQMQSTIPTLFAILAVVATLFLIFIGYTQVEVIRLFIRRWKMLGAGAEIPAVVEAGAADAVLMEDAEVGPEPEEADEEPVSSDSSPGR
jgi:hypothetical protein